jgi:leucyl/phenylalanyl-tRNA--protein transferase
MVLFIRELRVSRSLRRSVKSGQFSVTLDRAFRHVMAGCAEPRADAGGTWITDDMVEAYGELANRGFAHSVETWNDGRLVGGLYGVAIGRMFYGESMFSRQTDASKVALVTLTRQLERWGFEMIDCQMSTGHLASLGAREVPRTEFLERMRPLARQPDVPGPWTLDGDL